MQGVDPVVMKYSASGLNREAVNIAVANYGDNPTKVLYLVSFLYTFLFMYLLIALHTTQILSSGYSNRMSQ